VNRPIVQFFNGSIVNEFMTQFSANALCFGEGFPASGAPCHVEVSSCGLTVCFNAPPLEGNQELVGFTSMSVSAGGLDHDQLVITWLAAEGKRRFYLKDPAVILAFRRHAPPELIAPLEETAAQVRRARQHRRTVWGVVVAVTASLVLGSYFGSDLLVELAVGRIPVEWEQKIGESAYRDFLAGQVVLKEGRAPEAVKEITKRLADAIPSAPHTFQVSVVKNDVVNAFALPGGYVVVFTGLISKAESPDEVAGVLGHELNHVLKRHGLERMVKTLGLVAVVSILLGDQQGLIGLAKQLGVELLTLKFGRAQETEADVEGLKLLHRAKISPDGMIRFFERLSEQEAGRVEWLSTHPMSADRAARLKAEAAALSRPTPEPFAFDWQKIHESLGAAQAPTAKTE
jgi:Zn-dependent protease with chaperone function